MAVAIDLPYNIKITCMSPVEAFVNEIKIFDWQKVCLIAPSKALDCLIFYGSKVQLQPCVHWFSQFEGYLNPLKKGSDRQF